MSDKTCKRFPPLGTTYAYGDQINLSCGVGRYIKEQEITYCLYGQFTSPSEYPTCGGRRLNYINYKLCCQRARNYD